MKIIENLKSELQKQKKYFFEKISFKNFDFKLFLKENWGKFILSFFLIFFIYSFSNVKFLLNPKFLTQKHLVIFLNEAESRPCGGFATGYGEIQILPPSFFFKNIYTFEKENLGVQNYPLDLVAKQKKFWDLGDSENLSYCGKNFLFGYNQITHKDLKSSILVNFSFLERWLYIIGEINLGEHKINTQNFFATLSRKVSNVDRHDEKALDNRKNSLSVLAKNLVIQTLLNPHLWKSVSQLLEKEIISGKIYIENISPEIMSEENDFVFLEWNLGGGKSSRYLDKNIKIQLREISPKNWTIKTSINIDHLGSLDEPLSQFWKGVFEIKMPKFLGGEKKYFEKTIKPGESLTKNFESIYFGDIKNLSFFIPPSQNWHLDLQISVFGQQHILNQNLLQKVSTRENTLKYSENLTKSKTRFNWKISPDKIKPFITFHEIINAEILENSPEEKVQDFKEKNPSEFLFTEIHFNELVELQKDFEIKLQDRNYTNNITLKPEFKGALLLEDKTTLLAKFKITNFQNGERYYIKTKGVMDYFGNALGSGNRTVITR